MKAAQRINGFTHMNLTKLDVLSGMKEIQVCNAYFLDDKEVVNIPMITTACDRLKCQYISFPGWDEGISDCKTFENLPINAQKYIQYIEQELNCPIMCIGVGPKRDQLIIR
jgi:adenylosuccinate synthase